MLPTDAVTVPGGHGVGANEPVEQLEPAGQSKHWLSSALPEVLEKRPAGHRRPTALPGGQKRPRGQGSGVTVAALQV